MGRLNITETSTKTMPCQLFIKVPPAQPGQPEYTTLLVPPSRQGPAREAAFAYSAAIPAVPSAATDGAADRSPASLLALPLPVWRRLDRLQHQTLELGLRASLAKLCRQRRIQAAQICPLRLQQRVARLAADAGPGRFHHAPRRFQLGQRQPAEHAQRQAEKLRLVRARAMHALDSLVAIEAARTPPGADEAAAQRLGQGFREQTQAELATQRVGMGVAARGKPREPRRTGDEGHGERSFRHSRSTFRLMPKRPLPGKGDNPAGQATRAHMRAPLPTGGTPV